MKAILNGILALGLCLSVSFQMGCGASNAVKGGVIGAGAGGVVGGVIGHEVGNTAAGAIIGAAVGGTAGVLIGRHMDKQAEELRERLANAEIERVAEGIRVTFDSGILFEFDSSELQPAARATIEDMARVLVDYPESNIMIEGDTDNTGSAEYNQLLSERRAQAVADYSRALGISGSRVSTIGLGETNPIASNDTAAGREQNRRVEVAIFANDALKQAAENGTIN
jgi:outer membrane protein OmpA-like peptidoglycan-associated protein